VSCGRPAGVGVPVVSNLTRSFPTERARLKVRNPAGDVRVETAETAETTIELVPLNDSDATRNTIETASIGARGDEIFVELEGRSWSISIGNWGFSSAKVGVRITCPHGSTLDCDTASADVKTFGTLGGSRIRTASGGLELDRFSAELEAKSASGDIRVESVEGRAVVNTVSGDVAVRTALGGLAVNSVSGDVEAGEVTGDLSVQSVSGDQRVRAAGPGDLGFKAVSGDVQVGIRRGLRVRLDVNSVSGSIASELDVSDTPPASDAPETALRVRTVSGDVKIARAAEVAA
jgi:Putative adhesin